MLITQSKQMYIRSVIACTLEWTTVNTLVVVFQVLFTTHLYWIILFAVYIYILHFSWIILCICFGYLIFLNWNIWISISSISLQHLKIFNSLVEAMHTHSKNKSKWKIKHFSLRLPVFWNGLTLSFIRIHQDLLGQNLE